MAHDAGAAKTGRKPGLPRSTRSGGQLTKWDQALLLRHREFYEALDHGLRQPATAAQHHFVTVCRGTAKARTQHEIAYQRYVAAYGREVKGTGFVLVESSDSIYGDSAFNSIPDLPICCDSAFNSNSV